MQFKHFYILDCSQIILTEMSGKMDTKSLEMSKILSIFASSKQSSIINLGIHIGKNIEEEVRRQGLSVPQFADKIITSRSNVYNIFKAERIPIDKLKFYSEVLKKNLVQLIADKMDEDLGQTNASNTNEEYLDAISGKRMEYVRKYPHLDGKELEQTYQNREQLKNVGICTTMTTHSIWLICPNELINNTSECTIHSE